MMCTREKQAGTGAPTTPAPCWQPLRLPFTKPSGQAGVRSKASRCRRGAATVEFALIASVLFTLVLGIVEFSRAFMVTHLLTDTANHACRAAIVGGMTNDQISSLVTERLAAQGISGHTTTVSVNGAAGEASAATSGDEIEVMISVPSAAVGWLPSPRFLQVTLRGHWSMRTE